MLLAVFSVIFVFLAIFGLFVFCRELFSVRDDTVCPSEMLDDLCEDETGALKVIDGICDAADCDADTLSCTEKAADDNAAEDST